MVRTFLSSIALASLTMLVASACYRDPDNSPPGVVPPNVASQDCLQKLDKDLKVGDSGPDVRTVHDYLAMYGYYPNADLAAHFPAWRPLIANAPKDPNVFDQPTADAVRQLQVNYHLSPTGMVDGPTRAAMVTARCGVPDGIRRLDRSDKFSLGGGVIWRLQPIPTHIASSMLPFNITAAQFSSESSQAASTWAAASALVFSISDGARVNANPPSPDAGNTGTGGSSGSPSVITIQFGPIRRGRKQARPDVHVGDQRSDNPRPRGDVVHEYADSFERDRSAKRRSS